MGLSPAGRQNLSSSEKAVPRSQEGKSGCIQLCNKRSRQCKYQKIKYQVEEFSILWMGKCKPLGSLNSFFSDSPQLSGANPFFVHLALCIPPTLAWRVPWTGEPGGLLSLGSHRVGHHWSDLACLNALEKEMATHSNILAWRIPGTDKPGGLPFLGSHRVRHDWSDLAATAAAAAPQQSLWGVAAYSGSKFCGS